MRTLTSVLWISLAVLLIAGFSGCLKKDEQQDGEETVQAEVPSGDLNSGISTAMKKGAEYLVSNMNDRGIISIEYEGKQVPNAGITALGIVALTHIEDKSDSIREAISKGSEFLASLKKEDGGIYLSAKAAPPTYVTAVTIMALIRNAQDYLAGKQAKKTDDTTNYGGIGYGSDKTANLSTTQFALEALNESGYENDEVFKAAVQFLQRCQNNSETNDLPAAGNDGGFYYSTHSSKAGEITLENGKKGYKSYGSMTYAGIKSYIYADVDKTDPRVQNALTWIRNNYTVDSNPGMANPKMGLFYYFHTMAKTLSILDMDTFEDAAGVQHDWRKELAEKIISLQGENGAWKNSADRWYESIEPLATAYAIAALDYCRK